MAPARPLTRLTLASLTLAALSVPPPDPALAAGWTWPTEGRVIASYDGPAGDRFAAGRHRGIDIAAAVGSPVLAATDGEVTFSGRVADSGLTISIRTKDGRLDTSYLHLSESEVREGDPVAAGQPIARSGTSGAPAQAEPHLHFGVREAGTEDRYRDPLDFFPGALPPPTARPVPVVVPEPPMPSGRPAPAPRFVQAPEPRRRPVRLPHRPPVPARVIRTVPRAHAARIPAVDAGRSRAPGLAPAPPEPDFGPIADARPLGSARPRELAISSTSVADPGFIAAALAVGLLGLAGIVALARRRRASSIDARWPTTSPRRSIT